MSSIFKMFCGILFAAMIFNSSCQKEMKYKTLLFIGSYTEGVPDTGIYVYNFNDENGSLELVNQVTEIINPSFLTVSPDGKYLYSVTESKLDRHGSLTSFAIDSTIGNLTQISNQSVGGRNPVHLSIDDGNNYLVDCNFSDAGVAIFKLQPDGSLNPYSQLLEFKDSSIVKGRQDEAHIHSSNFSPDGKYLFVQDLGADKIRAFKVNQDTANILEVDSSKTLITKAGSGPRHFTFHKNGEFAYGLEEISGTISSYSYKDGILTPFQNISSYGTKEEEYRSADIHISPDGKFLYTSNRGPTENSIGIFSIDMKTGSLNLVDHISTFGDHPRNFAIDPSGKYLLVANQLTNDVIVFKRDLVTGKLTKTDIQIAVPNASCLSMRAYAID